MEESKQPESSNPLCSLQLPSSSACRIVKWVAEPGNRVRKGAVLVTYTVDLSSAEPESELPLKSTFVGVVRERLFEEGEIVQPGLVGTKSSSDVHVVIHTMYTYMIPKCTCTCRCPAHVHVVAPTAFKFWTKCLFNNNCTNGKSPHLHVYYTMACMGNGVWVASTMSVGV